jgi:hypothetical protein
VKDLKFKVKISEARDAQGSEEIQVDLVIDAARIRFQSVEARYQAKLYITTFYGDARGRYLGGAWQELAMNLKADTYQAALKSGIPYSVRIPRKVPGQTLKVVVYCYEADIVGSVTAKAK